MNGYSSRIASIRDHEFPGLSGLAYLDHAGATLYSRSQLDAVHGDLRANLYGNPHSPCPSSRLCTDTIEQVRYRILQHFNTTPECHSVIFTAGCTAALKLLADNFDWDSQNSGPQEAEERGKAWPGRQLRPGAETSRDDGASERGVGRCAEPPADCRAPRQPGAPRQEGAPGLFCYLSDNHTSVVGMREVARARGADVVCLAYGDIGEGAAPARLACLQESGGGRRNGLFAYPAQSNFSGTKYPLDLLASLDPLFGGARRAIRWTVALDAASLVGTSPLDLSACRADFVALSFYKVFGFPTGLGALVVRNDAAKYLRKTYFGGGTVQAYLVRRPFHEPKLNLSDRFEDGTLPFLDIIALKHGFDTLQKLAGSPSSISEHTFGLARYVHHALASYRHGNGRPVAVLYCRGDFESPDRQGPIVNFLLRRPDGELVGYTQIERLASLHGIHLRTGCFCNTGACQEHLGLKDQQVLQNFQAGHTCGDEMDIIDGQPTGSVRISFGYMSTLADADAFLNFVRECFVEGAVGPEASPVGGLNQDNEAARSVPGKKSSLNGESAPLVTGDGAEPGDPMEAEVKGRLQSEADVKGRLQPEADVNGRLQPEAEVKGRLQSEAEVNGRLQPEADVKGWLQPEAEVNGRLQSEADVKGWLQPEAEVNGRLQPEAEVNGRLQPEAEVKGRLQPEAEVNGRLQPEAEVNGRLQPEAEINGRLQPEAEVKGRLQPEADVKGRLRPEAEVNGRLQPEAEVKGRLQSEAAVKGRLRPEAVPAVTAPVVKMLSELPVGRVLTNIFLYPVKSCGALEVSEWEIGPKGLLYDRHWMVVNESGVCLSQKREERLCLIKPIIDLENKCLWLQCQGQLAITVPLDISREKNPDQASTNFIQSRVCMDRVKTIDCGDPVADWLSAALRRPCRLLQQNPEFERAYKLAKETCIGITESSCSSGQQGLSLVNDSPFTLLCRPSALSLLDAMGDRSQAIGVRGPGPGTVPDSQIQQLIGRFRGNLVVDGFGAFEEDGWTRLRIGDHVFMAPRACIRCQMVCVDQDTAQRSKEPLLTLSTFRGKKVPFGIHLLQEKDASQGTTLRVGDALTILGTQ